VLEHWLLEPAMRTTSLFVSQATTGLEHIAHRQDWLRFQATSKHKLFSSNVHTVHSPLLTCYWASRTWCCWQERACGWFITIQNMGPSPSPSCFAQTSVIYIYNDNLINYSLRNLTKRTNQKESRIQPSFLTLPSNTI
jgi:hypothetical protein